MSLVLTLDHQRGANFVQINIYEYLFNPSWWKFNIYVTYSIPCDENSIEINIYVISSIPCDENSIETKHIVTTVISEFSPISVKSIFKVVWLKIVVLWCDQVCMISVLFCRVNIQKQIKRGFLRFFPPTHCAAHTYQHSCNFIDLLSNKRRSQVHHKMKGFWHERAHIHTHSRTHTNRHTNKHTNTHTIKSDYTMPI